MTLDIIVPHYKEPWSDGKKLFDILALQRGVSFSDFRVILVNDGGENDPYPLIVRQKYPYEVVCLEIPHKGVSAARNKGLDYSRAEWVMFCDFDDTFTSIYSIRGIMDVLEDNNHDLFWTPLYMEISEKQNRQIRDDFNLVFIHGKIFRRRFLIEHGIKFCESLYFSEDTAFNRVVDMEIETGRVGKISNEIIPYVWAYRPGSATTDPKNVWSNHVGLFRRQKYVAEEYQRRGLDKEHDAMVIRAMCDIWVILNRSDLSNDRSAFIEESEEFLRNHSIDSEVNIDLVKKAYNAALAEMGVIPKVLPKYGVFLKWMKTKMKGCEADEGPQKHLSDEHQGLADQHLGSGRT